MYELVAHGLVEWANDMVEGEQYVSVLEVVTEAEGWAEAEGWTIEECDEGGFWMVEDGVQVYACLVREVKVYLDAM